MIKKYRLLKDYLHDSGVIYFAGTCLKEFTSKRMVFEGSIDTISKKLAENCPHFFEPIVEQEKKVLDFNITKGWLSTMNLKDKLHDNVFIPCKGDDLVSRRLVDIKGCWYKPVEQSYMLSPSELLELKKKWAAEAFDAGFKNSGENMIYHLIEITKPAPDKTQYINSITL